MRLDEKYIQDTAVDYLQKYYYNGQSKGAIYADTEKYTKQNLYHVKEGGKRADGLIVFYDKKGREITISLEAKSHKTISVLLFETTTKKWLKHYDAGFFTLFFLSFAILIFATFSTINIDSYNFFFLSCLVALILFFPVLYLFKNSSRYRHIPVFDQLEQYPANHQWIAIGKNSYSQKQALDRKELRKQCKKYNYGLIIVQQKGNPEILVKPKDKKDKKHTYLSNYSKEQDIRGVLKSGSPISLLQKWGIEQKNLPKRIHYASLGLSLIIFAFAIVINHDKTSNVLALNYSSNTTLNEEIKKKDITTPIIKQKTKPTVIIPPVIEQKKIVKHEVSTPKAKKNIEHVGNVTKPKKATPKSQEKTNTTTVENTAKGKEKKKIPNKRFIVVDMIFDTEKEAQKRVQELRRIGGKEVDYINLSKYNISTSGFKVGFCVYPFRPRRTEETILRKLGEFKKKAAKAKIKLSNPTFVRVIH